MGRVKSLSNSGCFVLRKDNQNAKSEYQVYIREASKYDLFFKSSFSISF